MNEELSDVALRELFDGEFQEYLAEPWAQEWRQRYAEHALRITGADQATWLSPKFQQSLWEDTSVTTIGPGNSVTVTGAYADQDLAKMLFQAAKEKMPDDVSLRGAKLQELYDHVIARITPRYSPRRPKARLVRLLAALFPQDMTCLMNAPRVWRVERLVGAPRLQGDFVAQNASIRERLRKALGLPTSMEDTVDQAIFSWFLWSKFADKPDEGAIESKQPPRQTDDLPALSLLPPGSQRRSLTCVQNNVSLLVAVVREAEQGISREDLISVIMQEAPQLNDGSASIIISQAAGGLGVIKLADGGYRPTDRGLDLLTAARPAEILQAPLVGRVFGMGHLLLILQRTSAGMSPLELSRYLQHLVPTWKTTQPGSYLVAWAKLVGFVEVKPSAGHSMLVLTDDGNDYASALPDDFEERWRIHDDAATSAIEEVGPSDQQEEASEDAATLSEFGVDDIIADGCFLPRDQIETALAHLRRKKNLILQGPPGTGKTWLAKRLGYALIRAKDRSRLTAVQFQPSLSYEDFVRGYRPGLDGRLDLVDGVFLNAIDQANSDPERPFVVVIEEINRGNPAQIFGELLTLLEHDKRGSAEALRLAYPRTPEEIVHIPQNLYVIGTMNIADRSLALVDLALRRRFAFRTLEPALGLAWRKWCEEKAGMDAGAVNEIAKRMGELNDLIVGDNSLGEQFRVGHSYVTPDPANPPSDPHFWFKEIVDAEIRPLLEEYWYDNLPKAKEACNALIAGL